MEEEGKEEDGKEEEGEEEEEKKSHAEEVIIHHLHRLHVFPVNRTSLFP